MRHLSDDLQNVDLFVESFRDMSIHVHDLLTLNCLDSWYSNILAISKKRLKWILFINCCFKILQKYVQILTENTLEDSNLMEMLHLLLLHLHWIWNYNNVTQDKEKTRQLKMAAPPNESFIRINAQQCLVESHSKLIRLLFCFVLYEVRMIQNNFDNCSTKMESLPQTRNIPEITKHK